MSNLPQQFQDRVRDRMKEVIGDLIPDDAWQSMVEKTIADFLRDELPKMIKSELGNQMSDRIKEELLSDKWQAQWKDGQQLAGPMMEEIIKQTAPDLVAALFGGLIQSAMYNFRNQLPRY